jgi:hypothetical protein
MFSSSIGGYLAGRLRMRWTGVRTEEVYFRDTAHGFAAWALATVVGIALLAGPSGNIIGNASSGAIQGATSLAASSPSDIYVDQLLRTETPNAQQSGSPTDTRAELGRLLTTSFQSGGSVVAEDRAYVAKVVASRTGLSQPEAEKRVNDVLTKAKSDLDAARKAAAQLAFWLTASLLIGAFCASLAATEGGALRDGTWRNKRNI